MAKIVYNNHQSCFFDLIGSTKKSAVLVSPFLKKDMAVKISTVLNENIELRVLTRLDNESMRQKAQDPEALKVFIQNFSNLEIKILDDLHAKIYLFDNKKALVTSANLTIRAFKSNIEYGVLLDEPGEIELIIEDVNKLYSKATRWEDYESTILSSVNQPKRTWLRNRDDLSDAIKSINSASFSPLERDEVDKTNGEKGSETISIKIRNRLIEVYYKLKNALRDAKILTKPNAHSLNEIEPIHFDGPIINKIRRLKLGDIIELDSKNDYNSNHEKFNLSGKYKIINSRAYKFDPDKNQFLIIEETLDNNTETELTRDSKPLMKGDRIDDCWSKVEDGICNWITVDPVFIGITDKEASHHLAVFKWRNGNKFSYDIKKNGRPDTWVRLRSTETDSEITLSEKQLIKFKR